MQDYAFTVKYNMPTDEYVKLYDDLFAKWAKQGVIVKYREMHTDVKIPHYHGLISMAKNFFFKKLMIKGFHVKFNMLFDNAGWIAYCRKNNVNVLPKLFAASAKLTLEGEVTSEHIGDPELATYETDDSPPIPRRSVFRRENI